MGRTTWPDGQPYTGAHWIYRGRRNALYLRDRLRCVYCEADCLVVERDRGGFTLDHIRSMLTGGDKHDPRNLATSCMVCNRRKGSGRPRELGPGAEYRVNLARRRKVPANRAGLALLRLSQQTGSRVAWALEAGWLDRASVQILVPELPYPADPAYEPDDFIPF